MGIYMEDNEYNEYIKKAFELKEQKQYKSAIEMLYKVLEYENENIETLFQIGELYFLLNNYEKSNKYLEKVLAVCPNNQDALKLLIEIKERRGDLNKALELAQNLYDNNQNSENLKTLVKVLIKTKSYKEIEKYVNSEFFNSDIKLDWANALYSNGETDKVKEILKNCDANDEKVLLLEGKIKFDEGDLEKSQEIFNRISANTQNPEILNYLGLFELENMHFIEGIKYFSKAAAINPSKSKYFYNLGNAYFYNGWMKEAQEAYTKALYISPDDLDYRYSLAYLYYEIGEYSKSSKEVNAILNLDSNHNRSLILKALLLAKNKDLLGAKSILENITNLEQDSYAQISLAKIYSELNIYDKAEQTLLKTISQNPQNLDYLNDLAEIYIQEKNYDKALEIADKIIEINPNYISGNILGAKSSYLKEDYQKTKEYAQNALELDINCSEGYYYLSLSREKTDDIDEAIECMKRAILYDLNNPKYYAQMSDYYKEKQDYKTALEYISEAESLDNTNQYKHRYSELVKLNRTK